MRDRRSDYVNQYLAESGVEDTFEPLQRAPTVRNHDDVVEMVKALADEAGAAVGDLEKRIELLEQKLGELQADLTVERAARNENVVDLPVDFLRRKNAAA